MEKVIVIIPTFNEYHLLKLQIPNIIRTLNPTHILLSEGLFPSGPETNLKITDEWISKWTNSKNNKLGFDTEKIQELVIKSNSKYDVEIKWMPAEFNSSWTSSECYTYSVSRFGDFGVTPTTGDIIFPYEPDMFHHESHLEILHSELKKLNPNESIKSWWLDFIGNQYYTENVNWIEYDSPKQRKLAIKFGSMEYYKSVVMGFETQSYPMCKLVDVLTYHYSWFRSGKYLDFRYAQIPRQPGYWDNWQRGLDMMSTEWKNKNDVVLRPKRSDAMRYAKYVELDHPSEIKEHECWVS